MFELASRIFALITLLVGSALFWAGMASDTYVSTQRFSNTNILVFKATQGLNGYCEQRHPKFEKICTRYTADTKPNYIVTTLALYIIWIIFDVIVILYLIMMLIRAFKDSIGYYDAFIISILVLVANAFLIATFTYFSQKIHDDSRAMVYDSGFNLCLAGYVLCSFAYLLTVLIPVIFWDYGPKTREKDLYTNPVSNVASNVYNQSLAYAPTLPISNPEIPIISNYEAAPPPSVYYATPYQDSLYEPAPYEPANYEATLYQPAPYQQPLPQPSLYQPIPVAPPPLIYQAPTNYSDHMYPSTNYELF